MLLKLPVFHVVLNMLRAQEKAKGKPGTSEFNNNHHQLYSSVPSSGHMPKWLAPGGELHPASRSTDSWGWAC